MLPAKFTQRYRPIGVSLVSQKLEDNLVNLSVSDFVRANPFLPFDIVTRCKAGLAIWKGV